MKVYISVDMEGITGIVSSEMTGSGRPLYNEGRELMVGDVNAAIAACFDAGAQEVWVKDAHAWALNVPIGKIDPRAQLISGWAAPACMVQGIDGSFDALILLGYHARAGSRGILAHTMRGTIADVRISGRSIGEIGISALHAGKFRVPVVAVTGCQVACDEARQLMPWVKTAVVKYPFGRESARCLPPKAARELIHKAVSEGLAALGSDDGPKPLDLGEPTAVEVRFTRADYADRAAAVPGVRRVDEVTVQFQAADGEELARKISLLA